MSYTSRFPQIAAELVGHIDAAVARGADGIAERAKERAPVRSGRLRDAIHTERVGVAQHAVVAGKGGVFYGHIVEHGGAHSPAQPFLIPAFEDGRDDVLHFATLAIQSL